MVLQFLAMEININYQLLDCLQFHYVFHPSKRVVYLAMVSGVGGFVGVTNGIGEIIFHQFCCHHVYHWTSFISNVVIVPMPSLLINRFSQSQLLLN
jgi:hypothetical protein